mgnify:CR=1 FL=1|jgi:hypothetical protein
MTERKIIITDDDEPADKFTHSTCVCKVCEGMKTSSKEWDEFSPKNNLQRRMKDVVGRIEAREAAKMTSEARDEQVASRPKKRARR